jgi:proline iminopeptidase
VAVENAELYFRETGRGQPVFELHGGPDFDHSSLLPEMDRLSDSMRMIYYDQRGRGRSARDVQPEDVSVESEIRDLERLREYFELERAAVLGHSWGAVLALEYARRHPRRVSHLILLNSAPVSEDDRMLFRRERERRWPGDVEELKAMAPGEGYKAGEPDAVADYYRVHFRATVRRPEQLEDVVRRLRASFTREGILKARAIEDRLVNETWLSGGYNLLPQLKELDVPTVVIHGEQDFIPVECAAHIAEAIPGAQLVVLKGCGHFSFLECPEEMGKAVEDFINGISPTDPTVQATRGTMNSAQGGDS